MKLIVTGGAGFVGSHLIELLITKKHFPFIVDNLSSGNYKYIKRHIDTSKAKFFKIDIRDYKKLKKLPKADAIIHLGAVASVVESISNPRYVSDVNVNGTLNMLELCKEKKIKKFIFASSAAIFGNYEKRISEMSPTEPVTVYGSTKLTGEQYCKIYSKLFGIKIIVLRPFNIYGKRQNDSYAGVIHKFLERVKNNKLPIIFGTGKQTRDFINVGDVVRVFEKSLHIKNTKKYDFFNLGTGKSISINYLAKACLEITNKNNFKPIYKKAIPGVVIHSSVDIKKLSKVFGFVPHFELRHGIKTMIENL